MQQQPNRAGRGCDISVIIATRDRPRQAERCASSVIDAMLDRSDLDCEIILVENGLPGEDRLQISETDRSRFKNIHQIFVGQPGLANARNIGIELARGAVLVFIDDDCTMARDYIANLWDHVAEWPDQFLCGGRVELGDPADLPFTIRLLDAREQYEKGRHPGGFIHGCNMVISRSAIDRIGTFDTRFGAGTSMRAAEDTDLIVRAVLANFFVECVADMCVLHYHGRTSISSVKRLNNNYSYGNGALYAKYGLSQIWLMKFFYWTCRSAIRESFGGPQLNKEVNLSYWPAVFANIRGALAFWARYGRQKHQARSY